MEATLVKDGVPMAILGRCGVGDGIGFEMY